MTDAHSGKEKIWSGKAGKFGGMDGSNSKSSQKGMPDILDQELLNGTTTRKRSKRGGKSVQRKRENALKFQNQEKENAIETSQGGKDMNGEIDTDQNK